MGVFFPDSLPYKHYAASRHTMQKRQRYLVRCSRRDILLLTWLVCGTIIGAALAWRLHSQIYSCLPPIDSAMRSFGFESGCNPLGRQRDEVLTAGATSAAGADTDDSEAKSRFFLQAVLLSLHRPSPPSSALDSADQEADERYTDTCRQWLEYQLFVGFQSILWGDAFLGGGAYEEQQKHLMTSVLRPYVASQQAEYHSFPNHAGAQPYLVAQHTLWSLLARVDSTWVMLFDSPASFPLTPSNLKPSCLAHWLAAKHRGEATVSVPILLSPHPPLSPPLDATLYRPDTLFDSASSSSSSSSSSTPSPSSPLPPLIFSSLRLVQPALLLQQLGSTLPGNSQSKRDTSLVGSASSFSSLKQLTEFSQLGVTYGEGYAHLARTHPSFSIYLSLFADHERGVTVPPSSSSSIPSSTSSPPSLYARVRKLLFPWMNTSASNSSSSSSSSSGSSSSGSSSSGSSGSASGRGSRAYQSLSLARQWLWRQQGAYLIVYADERREGSRWRGGEESRDEGNAAAGLVVDDEEGEEGIGKEAGEERRRQRESRKAASKCLGVLAIGHTAIARASARSAADRLARLSSSPHGQLLEALQEIKEEVAFVVQLEGSLSTNHTSGQPPAHLLGNISTDPSLLPLSALSSAVAAGGVYAAAAASAARVAAQNGREEGQVEEGMAVTGIDTHASSLQQQQQQQQQKQQQQQRQWQQQQQALRHHQESIDISDRVGSRAFPPPAMPEPLVPLPGHPPLLTSTLLLMAQSAAARQSYRSTHLRTQALPYLAAKQQALQKQLLQGKQVNAVGGQGRGMNTAGSTVGGLVRLAGTGVFSLKVDSFLPGADTASVGGRKQCRLASIVHNRCFEKDALQFWGLEMWTFIEYYRYAGTDCFYWYDEAREPSEDSAPVLQPYIDANLLTYTRLRDIVPNFPAFLKRTFVKRLQQTFVHMQQNFGHEVQWLLHVDIDEYFFRPPDTAPAFLWSLVQQLPNNTNQILVRDFFFVGRPVAPLSSLLLERYQWRFEHPDKPRHRTKCIVRMRDAPNWAWQFNQHDLMGERYRSFNMPVEELRMNHYWGPRFDIPIPLPPPELRERAKTDTTVAGRLVDKRPVVLDDSMLVFVPWLWQRLRAMGLPHLLAGALRKQKGRLQQRMERLDKQLREYVAARETRGGGGHL